ncbi:MAG: hypothetical protein AB1353_07780 [Aquificota bacterium]|jgi:Rod binding domain-containing protein|nr:hypothetical protein [Aquificaceae bacterium]MDM7266846.1 hypothetical protein [Aquificaceae bacterium]QWK13372.1 MAG: hypothetical protein KNN14_01830 [Aquificota bacterium]HAV40398.1 hypothetical protein [Aquificaceae bacterium]
MDKVLFSNPSLTYSELVKRDKRDIAKEFEAILLKEVLKEAFKPMLQNKSFDTKLYYDNFLEGLSKKLAEAGGIGIAKFILENIRDEKG